jgi:hypothetical protein
MGQDMGGLQRHSGDSSQDDRLFLRKDDSLCSRLSGASACLPGGWSLILALTEMGLMNTRHRPTKGLCEKAMAFTAASNLSGCSCSRQRYQMKSDMEGLACSCVHLKGRKTRTLSWKLEMSYCLYSESPLLSGEVSTCTTTTPSLSSEDHSGHGNL